MYDELVERLRRYVEIERSEHHGAELEAEAADAIEELSKRVPPVPHGDLIDRDALIKDGWLNLHKEVIRMGGYAIHELPLKNPSIPVIVPAEEEPIKDTNVPTTYDLLYEEGGYNSNGV